MKKTILLGMTAASAVVLLVSCSDDWGMKSNGSGSIAPLVGVDTQVITSKKSSDSQTASSSRAAGDAVTAADLSIRLTKSDGSWSNTWEKLTDFDATTQFAVGDYLIEAFYGNETEEGFEKPSYYGSQSVTVADQRTTEVAMTATMSKCMISIDYTDAFKKYMSSWSASIKGAGSAIEYVSTETRPLYLVPGEASITVNVVKPNGLKGSFDLAKVSTKARYSYRVTVDVNEGNVGDAVLTVSFDENLAHEDVTVDISDEIMNMPAPTLEAEGFEDGVPVNILSSIGTDIENLSMKVMALGGLKEINLTTKSEYLLSQGWPETIELLGATPEMQAKLKSLGFNALGVWKNPAEMAVLEFVGVASKIKSTSGDNTSTFTITVTDKLSRVSEPLTLEMMTREVTATIALTEELFVAGAETHLQISSNGSLNMLKKMLKLEFDHNHTGLWRTIEVEDVVATDTPDVYDVSFKAPAGISTDLNIRATIGDVVTPTVTMKQFVVTYNENDVFATSAIVTPNVDATLYIRAKGATDFSQATTDASYKLTGLTPGTEYEVIAKVGDKTTNPTSFTTEQAAQLENGDCESAPDKVASGNNWEEYSFPGGWGTNNKLTTSQGADLGYCRISGTKPADGASGKGIQLRTNGWGSGNTAAGTIVGKCKYIDAGLYHLGANRSARPSGFSDINGSLDTNDLDCGIAFASRPSSLSFKYKYEAKNSADHGEALIRVIDATGNVIAEAKSDLPAQSGFNTMTVPLNYTASAAKAAKLYVRFLSTNVESALAKDKNWLNVPAFGNLSRDEYSGSTLTIDDITLTY